MFQNIKEQILGNKAVVISVLAACCLLVAVLVTVGSLANAQNARVEAEREALEEQATNAGDEGRGERGGASEEDGAVEPSSAQKSLMASYGNEEEDFIDLLESYNWHGSDGRGLIIFKDGVMSESSYDGEEVETVTHAFAVASVSPNSVIADSDSGVEEKDAVIMLEDGTTAIMRAVRQADDEGTADEVEIISSLFDVQDTYTNAYASLDATITGLDDESLDGMIDGMGADLELAMIEWLGLNLPWVTEVEWTGSATLDTNADTVTIPFTVHNIKNSLNPANAEDGTLNVTYNRAEGTFSLEA